MSSKNDNNYNQVGFVLEILRLLAEKPHSRDELGRQLTEFLAKHGKPVGDIDQKIVRTIKKLRECGFEIDSAPNRPYKLSSSSFPVILSAEQRQSLALAAYLLSEIGFSTQASHVLKIGKLTDQDWPQYIQTRFSPPADYSAESIQKVISALEERFRQKRRYTIRYRNTKGDEQIFDCDCSELRLHDGVLYLFAWVPDSPFKIFPKSPNVEQNYTFRVDRIISVGAPSLTPWKEKNLPTFEVRYRMIKQLSDYQPRRSNERVLQRDPDGRFVEIVATEDSIFWCRQRFLQYGANVLLLEPNWLVDQIIAELLDATREYHLGRFSP